MGLDMYLNAKRFLWNEDELANKFSEVFPELNGRRVTEVVVEAVYWRKTNAIHRWFVENIQDGNDDCDDYYVPREKLEQLHQLILEVLAYRDATKLPPQAGFFFGSSEVDERYWSDLGSTAERLKSILEDFPLQWEFEYHSSW